MQANFINDIPFYKVDVARFRSICDTILNCVFFSLHADHARITQMQSTFQLMYSASGILMNAILDDNLVCLDFRGDNGNPLFIMSRA